MIIHDVHVIVIIILIFSWADYKASEHSGMKKTIVIHLQRSSLEFALLVKCARRSWRFPSFRSSETRAAHSWWSDSCGKIPEEVWGSGILLETRNAAFARSFFQAVKASQKPCLCFTWPVWPVMHSTTSLVQPFSSPGSDSNRTLGRAVHHLRWPGNNFRGLSSFRLCKPFF